jgi:hypothetical protein
MLMELESGFRRLSAPQHDGEKLIDPPWAALPEIVASGRQRLFETDYDVQGRALRDLAASARRTSVDRAAEYTRQYRDVTGAVRSGHMLANVPFILSGHQPQLFHPGVWYKNFVLGGLARRLDGVGIHLLIDSDLCRTSSIRVPTGTVDQPRMEAVPYDQPGPEVPYEERTIRDARSLASFAQRTVALTQPLVSDPLVNSMWPLVVECNPAQSNLGLRLAQGRHAYEQSWQNDTLELPQSAVCGMPEFAWFVAHVLAHLPRFWSAHNDALGAYRQAHRLRNRAHPVPDLAEMDGWLEAPFWIWSTDDPQRRPLYAHQSADAITLSDRHSRTVRLALTADRDATSAVEQLLDLGRRGIKIRTRALTTTLFARLILSDLFLHGIGGAKYDQVTDQIARQFFGFSLPEFATVSATLRLPIAHEHADTLQENELIQQAREMQFHPERFLNRNGLVRPDELSAVKEMLALKQRWVNTPKTVENAHERHVAISAANHALQPYLGEMRVQLERQREQLIQRKRGIAILESREYAFCLYPRWHFEKLLLADPTLVPKS